MKKFLLGFVIGLVFAGLVVVIIGLAAVAMVGAGQRPVQVADNSVLVLNLEGPVPERAPEDLAALILDQQAPLTVVESWQLMQKAAADSRIKGLVLEPRGLDIGWATLEELRSQITKFKESGKPVFAYLRSATAREYYVATAADQVFMSAEDWLDVKGLRAELMYLKGTLDKVGVDLEFEAVGLYKDAPDQYTETSPSPQTLEVTNQILDQYYGNLITAIAQGRKREPAAIRTLLDDGPFLGEAAVESGLLDALLYEDQVYQRLKERVNSSSDLAKVKATDYSRVSVSGFGSGSRIAFVAGDGEITRGSGDGLPETGITASGMIPVLRRVADDNNIKGVIVRVDSPGGDGTASDEILHEMKRLSEKKPVLISMSDLAASGGYFISMTGDPILAYSNTLTGSIGVYYGKANLGPLFEKIGLRTYLLTRGKYAAIDTAARPLTPDERAKLRREIELFYRGFVQRVADARKKPYEQVEPLAQGRVWLGAQAVQNGLVDEIGGIDRAVELIKERAKIPASERVTLVTYPQRRKLLDILLEQSRTETQLGEAVDRVVGRVPWRSLTQGGVLRLMPYAIDVR